ncbi:MAG: carboxypeptidase [Bdellovibrionaceae bacterium]|nr:carboxypeptidase [Pseudobdellovibrionaceae bacterium]|tara:strand:+ start:14300 stop:15199 length:900 start_codon:yes stop_codon:yes gene_type:complete
MTYIKYILPLLTVFLSFYTSAYEARTDRTYEEVQSFLQSLEERFPENVELFELTESNSGTSIQGIIVGSGSTTHLLVSNHHGNEYGAAEVALGFAEQIAEYPIADVQVVIVPVLNTWGYDRRSRREKGALYTHDPNRDYPGPCKSNEYFQLNSTKALADLLSSEGIVSAVTLHTYWPAVVYPWGHSTQDKETGYEDIFIQLGEWSTIKSNYQVGNAGEVIYPADGTFEDYAFWQHGTWSLLFELGFSHSPSLADIEVMVQHNTYGLREFFEKAPREVAENHAFTGECDFRLRALDLEIE